MEVILEIIFGFIGELILEVFGEVLIEVGFHGTAEKLSNRSGNRLLIGAVYAGFGALLGFLSLYLFPKMVFAGPAIPVLYFVFSPIVAGLSLTTVSWIINRGIRPVTWFELDKFGFGVVFALGYALSRLLFG
jgi:hypothetical protein